jgi:NDP-sugar pyrophosphorylase family protein
LPEDLKTAFVLGAGLGTRLRPLTEQLPKPLIPVYQKPLITFAFDHLRAAFPGLRRVIINTHHCPEAYSRQFPRHYYGDLELIFRHEPVRLETGGGIRNIQDLLDPGEPLVVYNGDILTDLPLADAWAAHREGGAEVTLVLRTQDEPRQITFDPQAGRVTDIRRELQPDTPGNAVFSGLYFIEPRFIKRLPPEEPHSVIPVFLEMLRQGVPIGGFAADYGLWRDLGTRDSYLRIHRDLAANQEQFPAYAAAAHDWRSQVHPAAQVHPHARLSGCSVVGAGARIGAGVVLQDAIVWPGSEVMDHSVLENCVVTGRSPISGEFHGEDL